MAAIDKIRGTGRQYNELVKWLEENRGSYEKFTGNVLHYYIYDEDIQLKNDYTIVNFCMLGDYWLLKNCPFQFVKNRIKSMYNLKEKEYELEMKWMLLSDIEREVGRKTLEFKEEIRKLQRDYEMINGNDNNT